MMGNRLVLAVVFFLAALPEAGAFHDLECSPARPTVTDEKTGEQKCLAQSPEARRQFLRSRTLQREQAKRTRDQLLRQTPRVTLRELQLEQEIRTRDLLLQQRQQVKLQDQIDKQARNRQQQFSRRRTLRLQEQALAIERSQKIQQGLSRQDIDAVRRKGLRLESERVLRENLLVQQINLPRADLLDNQKALTRRLRKDQLGQ